MPKLPACLSNLGAKFILLFPMKVGTVRPPESLAVRSPTHTPEYPTILTLISQRYGKLTERDFLRGDSIRDYHLGISSIASCSMSTAPTGIMDW